MMTFTRKAFLNALVCASALTATACGGAETGTRADTEMRAERGDVQMQGMDEMATTGEVDAMDDQERVTARANGQDVQVEDVILRTEEAGDSQLIFFRDDVDCTAVIETPVGDDRMVAMVEVEPGTDGLPRAGALPPAQWTYRVEGETKRGEGGEGWVHITRVPTTGRVEGVVTMETMIDDDRFQLEGPFTAGVCEVSRSGIAPRVSRR